MAKKRNRDGTTTHWDENGYAGKTASEKSLNPTVMDGVIPEEYESPYTGEFDPANTPEADSPEEYAALLATFKSKKRRYLRHEDGILAGSVGMGNRKGPVDSEGNRLYRTSQGWMSEADVAAKYGKRAYLSPAQIPRNADDGTFAGPGTAPDIGKLWHVRRRRRLATKIIRGAIDLPLYASVKLYNGWGAGRRTLNTGTDPIID